MRVSFGPTSELGPSMKVGRAGNHVRREDEENEEQGIPGEEQMIRQLKQEREDALKREEALKDRLTLYESISNKQIQDLKNQLKKLQQTEASQKGFPRSRDSFSSGSTTRSDRKRDGKSRDIREMQKTIGSLKAENEELMEKIEKLTDFVKIAHDIKAQATSQLSSKDEIIQGLRGELRAVENLSYEETRRRIQVQGELHSLQTYVDHLGHKSREKMKHRVVQTETSIPPKFIIAPRGTGSVVGFSSSQGTSFANLSAAAAFWRVKNVEKEYQEESRLSKQKFRNATNNQQERGKCTRTKFNSVSEYPRQKTADNPGHEKSSGGVPRKGSSSSSRRQQDDRPSTRASYASSQNIPLHSHVVFSA